MRNCETRDNYIKKFGQQKFDSLASNPENRFSQYQDIEIPVQYLYTWEHFIAIWQQCEFDFGGNRIFTYHTVLEYEQCMKVSLPIKVKRMMFRIKQWVLEEIAKQDED